MVSTKIIQAEGTPPGVDENAVEVALRRQAVEQAKSARKRAKPAERSTKPVKVVCTVDCGPWVELPADPDGYPSSEHRHIEYSDNGDGAVERGPMAHNEILEIPEWVADLLVGNRHAVRV